MNECHKEIKFKTEHEPAQKYNKKFLIQKCESDSAIKDINSHVGLNCIINSQEKSIDSNFENAAENSYSFNFNNEKCLGQKSSRDSNEDLSNPESKSVTNYIKNTNDYNTGRWTDLEHKKFLEAILLYGNEWKKVQKYIGTRSSTQARSHAQKFFLRLKKNIKFTDEFNDPTLNTNFIVNMEPDRNKKSNCLFYFTKLKNILIFFVVM